MSKLWWLGLKRRLKWWGPQYIGGRDEPYLVRWFIIPHNKWFNLYLHKFCRSDDDRALHDHPWASCSIILKGMYMEHVPITRGEELPESFTLTTYRVKKAGSVTFRRAVQAHRIELFVKNFDKKRDCFVPPKERPVWTLFMTGPKTRSWGFHCPQGWRHWREFTDESGNGIGKGCA